MEPSQTANKIPLPPPRIFSIALLRSTGQYSNEYPTFSLSYVGMPEDDVPDYDMIGDIQAFSSPFTAGTGEETELELIAFFQPRNDLLGFADSAFIKVPVNTKSANEFFRTIGDLGQYVVIINTDTFMYRALVDDSTGEVLEAAFDYRLLN